MERASAQPDGVPLAEMVIDAGNEEWVVLQAVMERCMSRASARAILEIVSQDPRNRATIPIWCCMHGHELVYQLVEGEQTRFWIAKGEVWREDAEGHVS